MSHSPVAMPLDGRTRGGSRGGRRKTGGHEFCQGYLDEYGQWNTGFYCPRWGGPDETYCCGDAVSRVCCSKPVAPTEPPKSFTFIPILIGIGATLFVLTAALLIGCFFCRCCPGYKRRRRREPKPDVPDNEAEIPLQPPSPEPATPPPPQPPTCSTCHQIVTVSGLSPSSTDPEHLHCGCRWSPTLSRNGPMSDLETIMKTLYGDAWQPELEGIDYPVDDPPPYTERDITKLHLECKTLGRKRGHKSKEDKDNEFLVPRTLSDPSELCMTTFRPVGLQRANHRTDADAKRDSGVLVEDIEGATELPPEREVAMETGCESPFLLDGGRQQHQPMLSRPGMGRMDRSITEADFNLDMSYNP